MAAPRQAVNGSTNSVGFTSKLVTVQAISPDGKTAVAVDRQNTQVSVPMMIQRSKSQLPQPGETWMVTQADAGQYTFSAVVATSAGQFPSAQAVGIIVNATAPAAPSVGEVWINPSEGNSVSTWNGTSWVPLQFSSQAIAPQAITAAQIAAQANIAASQVNFTASDIGGVTTTISGTAPEDPSYGDLWYNAEDGYQLNQWTGVEWTPYQWGTQAIAARSVTAELIAANTITAEQIAAGIVIAGIIDGTFVDAATFTGSVFQGTDFVINPAGSFFYSGTPASGNLIASIAAASGIDAEGNVYAQGLWVWGSGNSSAGLLVSDGDAILALTAGGRTHATLNGQIFGTVTNAGDVNEYAGLIMTSGKEGGDDAAIQLFSESADSTVPAKIVFEFGGAVFSQITKTGIVLPGGGTPAAVSGSASVYATTAGTLQVVDGVDEQAYSTQRRSLVSTSAQPITSTTFGSVFSSTVGARTYRIHGQLYVVASQNGGDLGFQWAGPGSPGGLISFVAAEGANTWSAGAKAAGSAATFGITMVSGDVYVVTIDGAVAFTSTGTFAIEAACVTSGDGFQVGAYSFLDVLPVLALSRWPGRKGGGLERPTAHWRRSPRFRARFRYGDRGRLRAPADSLRLVRALRKRPVQPELGLGADGLSRCAAEFRHPGDGCLRGTAGAQRAHGGAAARAQVRVHDQHPEPAQRRRRDLRGQQHHGLSGDPAGRGAGYRHPYHDGGHAGAGVEDGHRLMTTPTSQSDISSQIIAVLAASEPDLDTTVGSVTRKIIDAVAASISSASLNSQMLSYQYDINSMTGSALDSFVQLFGMSRYPATRSVGTVSFTRGTAVDTVSVPVGTQIASENGSVVVQTLTAAILDPAALTGAAPVQAVTAGPQGNVSTGTLTQIQTPVAEVTACTNVTALTGGANQETDAQLQARWSATVFKNMAGTSQMFLGLATNDPDCTAANVVDGATRFREQLQVTSGSATSTVSDAQYTYPSGQVCGTDIDNGNVAAPGTQYTWNYQDDPPSISVIDSSYFPNGELIDLSFLYMDTYSRNSPEEGIYTRVDVWCAGSRPAAAATTVNYTSATVFSASTGSSWYAGDFIRPDGTLPVAGNVFLALPWGPILTVPPVLVVDGVTYGQATPQYPLGAVSGGVTYAYQVVHRSGAFGWSPYSDFGLEWDASYQPPARSPVTLSEDYTYNDVPAAIQANFESWRLAGQDVLAHQGIEVDLQFSLAVIFDPGVTQSVTLTAINTSLQTYLSQLGFNSRIYPSSVIQAVESTTGVTASRFLTGADYSTWSSSDPNAFNVGIQQVYEGVVTQSYVDSGGNPVDIVLGAAQLPTFGGVVVVAKANNTMGSYA
jgi:uncharacterized phage protein gp47/JayE